ncbi:MAG: damage-inducible protein, partial [Verrucomicrobiota bacterium]|nr:damage-inducible protein [Verrucomicrobiota bacterium]
IRTSIYRPFCKQWVYFDKGLNEYTNRMPKFFPTAESENKLICVTGVGNRNAFSVIISDCLPDLHMADSNGASQNFPLYFYEKDEPKKSKEGEEKKLRQGEIIAKETKGELVDGYYRRDAIGDEVLGKFHTAYKDAKIGKEDIFYYVYGVLHSPEYKTRFAADLKKMLPRIPFAKDFWAFSRAGRDLAKIHLNYETAQPYENVKEEKDELGLDKKNFYLVEKMRFGKTLRTATTAPETDKTKIQYNSHITLTGIPLAAYDYIVNGKPAIEWIIDRYQMTTDKDSGLTNNPNDWATEHNDPAYILNLLKRIITVSMETMEIVKALPPLCEKK